MAPTLLLCVLGLAAAAYSHIQVPRFVATRAGVIATRGILLVVGLASGYVAAAVSTQSSLHWLTFLGAFGAVHVPAAVILMIKRARHAPRT